MNVLADLVIVVSKNPPHTTLLQMRVNPGLILFARWCIFLNSTEDDNTGGFLKKPITAQVIFTSANPNTAAETAVVKPPLF